jgi:hypothetical protein
METFKLGNICHNITIWTLKLFFVLKFHVPIIKYCVKSYKLCCFISISWSSTPLDPLIMMKRHRTVIFFHIKIMGWNWNIISNDQFSLSTWVQRVMIISDDTPWSYIYIDGVEIGFKIWKLEPEVSEWSKFIILSTFLTAIRLVLRICLSIRRLTYWTTLEYI